MEPGAGPTPVSRRRLLAMGGGAGAALVWSCRFDGLGGGRTTTGSEPVGERPAPEQGRLTSRPQPPGRGGPAPAPGLRPVGLRAERDGVVLVPAGYRPEHPAPLVVMLHGAGGNAQHGLAPLQDLADAAGLILLAPASLGRTWDLLVGGFGADVADIDAALARAFAEYAVDPAVVAVGGFSDGASYALSLGITNGDLFRAVVAFSPGFSSPGRAHGSPRIFVSHGTDDQVLPIESCSRRIVPRLQRAGYDVRYREFPGPHAVPPAIAKEAVTWLLAGRGEAPSPGTTGGTAGGRPAPPGVP